MADVSPIPSNRADTVLRLARMQGFALVGIAAARPAEHAAYLRQWLEQGRHGQMDYLLTQLQERLDPAKLVPGARSVICVADVHPVQPPQGQTGSHEKKVDEPMHGAGHEAGPHLQELDQPQGRIARYAWSGDYHWIIKNRLHQLADALRGYYPDHTYRSCVDTAPTLEREHALRAGLGWVGKNTMLIHPQVGSYFLLGEIITTLPLASAQDLGITHSDHCGTCTRCIEACPTQCLEPYRIDASRCISYLTIEHRDTIDPSLHPLMGDWLAGCDVCQEVCPFNDGADRPGTMHPKYQRNTPGKSLPVLEVLGWDEAARQKALVNSALKRIKLDQFKRNALIVAGNLLDQTREPGMGTGVGKAANPGAGGQTQLLDRIRTIARDVNESEMVRVTAAQVLERSVNPRRPA